MRYDDELYGRVEITEPVLRDLTASDAVPRTKGFINIQIPGDRGHAMQKQCMASGGMEIDGTLLEELRVMAQ
jgi:LDH2 family malate/lactate/ureidoglycolate dehydrogenase